MGFIVASFLASSGTSVVSNCFVLLPFASLCDASHMSLPENFCWPLLDQSLWVTLLGEGSEILTLKLPHTLCLKG